MIDYGETIRTLIDPDTDWDGDDASITCHNGCCIEIDCDECSCGHKNPLMEAGLV